MLPTGACRRKFAPKYGAKGREPDLRFGWKPICIQSLPDPLGRPVAELDHRHPSAAFEARSKGIDRIVREVESDAISALGVQVDDLRVILPRCQMQNLKQLDPLRLRIEHCATASHQSVVLLHMCSSDAGHSRSGVERRHYHPRRTDSRRCLLSA